jgi:hypothetical protein
MLFVAHERDPFGKPASQHHRILAFFGKMLGYRL